MKVLWITNINFPDVCIELGIPVPEICGWIYSSAKALLKEFEEIEFAVASFHNGDIVKTLHLNGITYFLVPKNSEKTMDDIVIENFWKDIKKQFSPDIVHIHGTESPHGLAYIVACNKKHVIVSIQGMVSVCEKYYYGGIPKKQIFKNITLRDIIRNDSIFNQHANMYRRGLIEKKTIQTIEHVIGRTAWDKAHVWAINPNVKYHFCNETLRSEFYKYNWDIDKCESHSIFISQAHYPLKGLHQMIKALPIVLSHYPDAKLYIAGTDFISDKGLRLTGYGKYIRSLIKKYGIKNQLVFTGILSEEEMCQRFLKSHLFVCPSSIENSSNSIGEAQLMGVPCIASYVGGISDLITDNESGLLYRFEETEMLAAAICTVFSDDFLAKKLSKNARAEALLRHDNKQNAHQLGLIYKSVIQND